jgi:hypothetical protein
MSLEQFRPVCDGRKWKQSAGTLWDCLSRLASYANPDGTFIKDGVDYSPTWKTLCKRYAKNSLWRNEDKLRELGFISWTREKHRERRSYVLHMDKIRGEQVPYSGEQVPHSTGTGSRLDGNRFQIGQEQVPHSTGTGSTRDPHPSLPSLPVLKPSLPVTAADGWDWNFLPQGMPMPSKQGRSDTDALIDEFGASIVRGAVGDWLRARGREAFTFRKAWEAFAVEGRQFCEERSRPVTPELTPEQIEAERIRHVAMYGDLDEDYYTRKLREARADYDLNRNLFDEETQQQMLDEIAEYEQKLEELRKTA